MTPDRKGCVDKNECLDSPCRNGGVCLNQDPRIRYRCICPDGFWGENCELVQEGQKLKLGMGALAAILVCLLIILSEYWHFVPPSQWCQKYDHICKAMYINVGCKPHLS